MTSPTLSPVPRYLSLAIVASAAAIVFASPVYAAGESAKTGAGTFAGNPEAAFIADNDAAMNTMMEGMSAKPAGDVDHDFVNMMVPHHQGAIDMAQAELRYGHNEQLRRIAQEIVVEQQQEIVAMRIALGQPLPPSAPAPDQQQPAAAPHQPHSNPPHAGMNMSKETQ